jgi:cytochrome P450
VPPLFSSAFAADPWATFAWLQAEAPLFSDPASRMTVLTRYDDCAAALRHPGMSAAGGQQDRRDRGGVPRSMLTTDGAEHDALRRPGTRLMGPAAVRDLAERLAPQVGRLMAERTAGGAPVDLLTGLGEPVATLAIAALLGLSGETDLAELDRHAQAVQVNLNPVPDPRTAQAGRDSMTAFVAFLDGVLAAPDAGSVLAALCADPELPREDLVGVLTLSMVGGWAPLAEAFTAVARVVLDDPALAAGAGSGDGAGLLVEEVLRWHTPIPFVARRTTEPVPLPSGEVPAGSMVLAMVLAANRDASVFADPHEVRPGRTPGPHLALGAGPHFCLGAALVRAVVPLALAAFMQVRPRPAHPDSGLRWQPSLFPRRIVSVPIVAGSRAR